MHEVHARVTSRKVKKMTVGTPGEHEFVSTDQSAQVGDIHQNADAAAVVAPTVTLLAGAQVSARPHSLRQFSSRKEFSKFASA